MSRSKILKLKKISNYRFINKKKDIFLFIIRNLIDSKELYKQLELCLITFKKY